MTIKISNVGRVAYYQAKFDDFRGTSEEEILGTLAMRHGFALEHQQKHAWRDQIRILKKNLQTIKEGWIFFEFSIPRMGKRADVVLVLEGIVFVLEFKVGATNFDRNAVDQVWDYALDLKNFHRGSHSVPIVPILIPTAANSQPSMNIFWADDMVAQPLGAPPDNLRKTIDATIAS